MTRIEKETVIRALAYYHESQVRKSNIARKKGENKKAVDYSSEADIAQSMVSEFCRILTEPCGSCMI